MFYVQNVSVYLVVLNSVIIGKKFKYKFIQEISTQNILFASTLYDDCQK